MPTETFIVFQRQMRILLRNPVWVFFGLSQPIIYLVLFGPLLFPIAHQMGVHEVHYAMVVILAMGIGLFAPPFGVGYYAACAIGRVNPDEGIKAIWPYLFALLIGLLVVAAIPFRRRLPGSSAGSRPA